MIGKPDKTPQLNMYKVPLLRFINKDHELYILTERINWDELEQDLSEYYCVNNGRPSIPIRKIVGVILLKRMLKYKDYIHTFLFHPKEPPDNNSSERAIRNVKVKQ